MTPLVGPHLARGGAPAEQSTGPRWVLREYLLVRWRTWSVLVSRRSLGGCVGFGLLVLLAVGASLLLGTTMLSADQVVTALRGQGAPATVLLVREIRLPRAVAGWLAGMALGVAGCLTQTLARNRLATPDVLGVNDGAGLAVLLMALASSSGLIGGWWVGPLGAVVVALLIVLAAGETGTRGYSVLVVGLGISTLIGALDQFILSTREVQLASGIFAWTIGSLLGRGYTTVVPVGLCLALLLPLVGWLARTVAVLRFDDDMAAALGLDVPRARLTALLLAVVLAGLGVGVGGPIRFVALAAPIIASRFVGGEPVPLLVSGLLGGVLVVVADTLGRVIAPVEIPVGVVASVLGGPFLLWVLLNDPEPRRF